MGLKSISIIVASITFLLIVGWLVMGRQKATAPANKTATHEVQDGDFTTERLEEPELSQPVLATSEQTTSSTTSSSVNISTHSVNGQSTSTISIAGNGYSTVDLTLQKGAVVTWVNTDNVPHAVASDETSAEQFHGPELKPGESFTYTFNNPGTFTYHCQLHANVKGSVTITN